MEVTDEIKSRLDIVELISEHVPLRKSGSSFSGFCPFHPNSRTPAFVVFPNTQTWRCFGACAEGGDIFSFVMKKQGWDFKETLRYLADRAGVELAPPTQANKEKLALEDKLGDLLEAAADYYHQLLLYAPQGEVARDYITDRGLSEGTLTTFKIGYALDSWDACRNHFNAQGYSDDQLQDAGLLTFNKEKGSRYDRFRNRLMIPIRDAGGRMAGFGARTLDPDGIPKYLNSPQTAVFDKSRLLFGLDLVKRHIREARQVIIVEGYMDVMQAWQQEFKNVVAQMGTALTEEQLRLVKRYTKRFVLALDADAAGASATLRSLEVARGVLDREPDARFDARGLVRNEGRLQAEIRIVSLPEGDDPDKIIRRDPALWSKLIEQAKPVVAYVIDVAVEGLDLDDPKAKTAAAQQVLPLINDVEDPLEREHYRQMLARKLGVDERVLRKVSLPARPRRRPVVAPAAEDRPPAPEEPGRAEAIGLATIMHGSSDASERRRAYFMRQCLAHPHIIRQIDKKLALNQQATLSEDDFSRPDDRALWREVRLASDRRTIASPVDLWDSLEEEFLQARVKTLLSLPESPETELERLPERLVLSVLDWRLEKVKRLIAEVEQLFLESRAQNKLDMLEMYRQQLRELPLQVRRINRAREAMSAVGRRNAGSATGQYRNQHPVEDALGD
ncbi:MAG TPA: DNA primase [Anaerolineae bacterium]|jgi:DNA primase|nr:DNA primase [Anaerolineae bacterium]